MSDINNFNNYHHDVAQAFDQDHTSSAHSTVYHPDATAFHPHHSNLFTHHDVYQFDDPLKHVQSYNFKPLMLQMDNIHFVHPHDVQGYVKKDGTVVNGYYRDGDGDTSVNRNVSQGGGYYQSNPDR